jgi:hydroxypyruvate reductase/glycerate 2-kinase
MNYLDIAEKIFITAIESVHPEKLIKDQVKLTGSVLSAGSLNIPLQTIENIYIIGAGKATAAMAVSIEEILGSRITGGHVVVKYNHSLKLKYIGITEAGHPIPDSNGFKATRKIVKIANKAADNDLVICLLSGGGSALLADYPDGSSGEDMIILNDLLVRSGADIKEINTVRKHLSRVKGGQLARSVYPATLVNLMLSDVPGDSPEIIASGPTYPDSSTFNEAIRILEKYHLNDIIPSGLIRYLLEGGQGLRPETPKPGDPVFKKSYNFLIGTNKTALEAARDKAIQSGLNSYIIDDDLHGNVGEVALYLVETAIRYKENIKAAKPACLLFGGETTIAVKGNGLGGRNQHLALSCAVLLQNQSGITILAAGTDGTDGATDAAGAVVDCRTVNKALLKNQNPQSYLMNFDSYHFFRNSGGHIITGPTMTNVMDIVVVIVE